MEEALGANGTPHPQLVANDMVATVDDPELGHDDADRRADPPARHAGRDPGAATAARAAQRRDPRRARLLGRRDRDVSRAGGGLMHALEGVLLIDFGQYLAGPFGPMIIGDLGADVIKVEPVTGDGMRMASKPFFGCQRGKRDIALNLKTHAGSRSRCELVERRRHRPPQHDRRRREAARHRLRRLQAREPRHRLLQHLGVRPRGSARALRRPRPALPGGGRARVRGRARCATATRRSTTASGCATPPTRCSRSSAASPRCTTSAGPARARSCGRRCSTAARCSRPTCCSSTAKPCRGRGSTRASTGIDACYRLYETQDGWIQIAAVEASSGSRLCGALGVPELADDARFAIARPRREHRHQLESLLEPRFATRTAIVVDARARRRRRAERGPASTRNAGEHVLFDADNERARPRRRVRAPDRRPHAPVRRAHRLLGDARPIARPAAARRRAHRGDPRVARLRRRARSTRSRPTASSTGPTTTTPGTDPPWTV